MECEGIVLPAVALQAAQAASQAGAQSIQAVGGTIVGLAQAETDRFRAAKEAESRIRASEMALAEAISTGAFNQFGRVLSTLDRPFLITDYPNEGGGTTKLNISMHTIIGIMVVMQAWRDKDLEYTTKQTEMPEGMSREALVEWGTALHDMGYTQGGTAIMNLFGPGKDRYVDGPGAAWQRLMDAYISTFSYVPDVAETGMGAIEKSV